MNYNNHKTIALKPYISVLNEHHEFLQEMLVLVSIISKSDFAYYHSSLQSTIFDPLISVKETIQESLPSSIQLYNNQSNCYERLKRNIEQITCPDILKKYFQNSPENLPTSVTRNQIKFDEPYGIIKSMGPILFAMLITPFYGSSIIVKASLTQSLKNQSKTEPDPDLTPINRINAMLAGTFFATALTSLLVIPIYTWAHLATDDQKDYYSGFVPVILSSLAFNLLTSGLSCYSYDRNHYDDLIFSNGRTSRIISKSNPV
tara:strand:+ start:2824 stop:3603 length:780 start_codon:yes stop_codon:yes gene_type:complete